MYVVRLWILDPFLTPSESQAVKIQCRKSKKFTTRVGKQSRGFISHFEKNIDFGKRLCDNWKKSNYRHKWYNINMIFGYIDESGAPGVATYSKDCLLVSLVLFESEDARDKAISAVENLREKLHLPDDYEFHCNSNSTRPQTEFLKLLGNIDFRFITVAIHKNDFRKTASYARISSLVMDEIEKRFPEIKIEMDSNPTLHAELRKRIKERKLKNIKIRERNSRHSRLIQVADYVVSISARKVKNTPKARDWYKPIAKKVLSFVEIAD